MVSPYKYEFDPNDGSTAAKVVRQIGRNKYVLELGCAYGGTTKILVEQAGCRVVGIEYDKESAEQARPYCEELFVLNLETANLKEVLGDKRFDVIVGADVFEHLRNPGPILNELKKFLKPDGYLVLSIPNVAYNGIVAELLNEDFRYRRTGLLDSTHLRFFAVEGFKRLLYEAGFSISSIEATKMDVEQSEFSTSWSLIPQWLKQALGSRPNGDVYQYVATAFPAEDHTLLDSDIWPITVGLPGTLDFEQQLTELARQLANTKKKYIERDLAAKSAEQKAALLNATIEQMKSSRIWRMTRPVRFMNRVARDGFTIEDRQHIMQSLRRRYHNLPLPPWFKKAVSFLSHGLIGPQLSTVRRFLRRFRKFRAPATRPAEQIENTPDYIFWGIINWHFRHQRPQQLARALAASDRRVFYVSPSFTDDNRAGFSVEQIDNAGRIFQISLFIRGTPEIYSVAPEQNIVDQLRASIGEVLEWANSKQIVSLVQHPFWTDIASVIPDSRLVYDCMDHHEGFGNTGLSLLRLEKELFSIADLTITTSSWLDKTVAGFVQRRALIRNAGDHKHFATPPESIYRDPLGRRVLGYYGAIAEWFDVELIKAVAMKFPECSVLLIGADTINAKAELRKYSNVTFVGEVPYSKLPHYLHAFDICLLPFMVVPLTIATNPVKAYEYLSAGKPVVSLNLPEMAQFEGLAYVANDHDEFLAMVGQALANPEPASLLARRKSFAEKETWIHRGQALIEAAESSSADETVSVIVVTYNNLDLTRACLTSLDKHSHYQKLEIIVVDNASADGSPEFLKTWVAGAKNRKLILNEDNRGFAAANNQGLQMASGDYLVMLNNDTYVTPGWIRTLVGHLKRDRTIGLIGPVTNNIGNESKIDIQYGGMEEMISRSAEFTRRHLGQTYPLRTAAFFCVMLRKETFEKIGPLDQVFGRGFFEDDDYCRRIEKEGLRVVCADDVFVHHQLSASFNKLKQQDRQKLFEENKKIYEAKWGPWIPHEYRKHSALKRVET